MDGETTSLFILQRAERKMQNNILMDVFRFCVDLALKDRFAYFKVLKQLSNARMNIDSRLALLVIIIPSVHAGH